MKKLTVLVVTLFLTGLLPLAHAGTRTLNPQPLPTGLKHGTFSTANYSKVQVNPQPLPPGTQTTNQTIKPGSKLELNPQPLPPGAPQGKRAK
jgi:hypothetical protein